MEGMLEAGEILTTGEYVVQLEQLLALVQSGADAQYALLVLVSALLFYLVFFHGKGRY